MSDIDDKAEAEERAYYAEKEREEYEAEIKRLRAALREISMDMPTGRSARIARRALKHDL